MYAVIRTGSSQTRVEQGQVVRIDRRSEAEGSSISLIPVMIVDGDTVLSTPSDLASASVTGRLSGSVAAASRSRSRWPASL